jgi:hypothetical protein
MLFWILYIIFLFVIVILTFGGAMNFFYKMLFNRKKH